MSIENRKVSSEEKDAEAFCAGVSKGFKTIFKPLAHNLRIGSVQGVGIFLHATFLWYFAFIFVTGLLPNFIYGNDLSDDIRRFYILVFVFGSVLLHEMCHTVVALKLGCKVRHITLLPIGGVASMEKMPDSPKSELLIVVAGPLCNVLLALLVGSIYAKLQWDVLKYFVYVNVALAVFNLIPLFPMDGGRILRAVMEMSYGKEKATKRAVSYGVFFVALFLFYGFAANDYILVFIALFIGLAGYVEFRSVKESILELQKRKVDDFFDEYEKCDTQRKKLELIWKFMYDPDITVALKCNVVHSMLQETKNAVPECSKSYKCKIDLDNKALPRDCPDFGSVMKKIKEAHEYWVAADDFNEAIENLPEEARAAAKTDPKKGPVAVAN